MHKQEHADLRSYPTKLMVICSLRISPVWYHDDNDISHPSPLATISNRVCVGDQLVLVLTRDFPAPSSHYYTSDKMWMHETSCRFHCSSRSEHLNCSEMCMRRCDEEVTVNVSQKLLRSK